MFLKVSKRKIEEWCEDGHKREPVQVGTIFAFSLVESLREGGKNKHKSLLFMGRYVRIDYEPIKFKYDIGRYGNTYKRYFVNSFDVADTSSFRPQEPEKPFRFYSTFGNRLQELRRSGLLPRDAEDGIVRKVTGLIPLYSIEDYNKYIKKAACDMIKNMAAKDKLDGLFDSGVKFDACSMVMIRDGQLKVYQNKMMVQASYKWNL